MSTDPPPISDLGRAVDEIREKVQLLVNEEIALAKAELSEKVSKIIKGAVAGILGGVFALFALIYLFEALAWGVYDLGWSGTTHYWVGFLIVAVFLLLIGAIAAFVATRLIKRGSPPTPQMALEEGKLIKETLQHPRPLPARGATTGDVPAAPAAAAPDVTAAREAGR